MKKIKQLIDRIRWSLIADFHFFWDRRSPAQKGCLGCFGMLLASIGLTALNIIVVIGFVLLMSALNSNKSYEFLYPAQNIAAVEIIYIEDDVGLYHLPLEDIEETLDSLTRRITVLETEEWDECVTALSELPASMWWNDPNPYIQDGTLLITYQDGSREWICADGTFYCDLSSGKSSMTWYYFENEQFDQFLETYGYCPP